jgi:diguanylate cyclase (GGDEF)-like protein
LNNTWVSAMPDSLLDSARILIVDDNPANVELLRHLLEDAGYDDLLGITDPRQVIGEIERRLPDLVLLDIRMPHLNGFEVLERVRAATGALAPPVIVLTAQTDRETCSRALELGAIDFLNKPFDNGEVLKRIRNILLAQLRSRDLREQKELLQELVDEQTAALRQQALRDGVTGLPNRRALLDELQRRLQAGQEVAVYFIVADEIEEIARLHGYPVAEKLLQELGELLTSSPLASGGMAGCWGGSELVLLRGDAASVTVQERTAQRLQRLLAGDLRVDDLLLATGVRVGIAHSVDGAGSGEELLRQAATALPAPFGPAWRRYTPFLAEILAERRRLRRALRQAIPMQELALVYQPKVDLETARLVGAEALLRWHSAELGPMRPDIFIPLAEETGDIHAIGDWVLDAALRQLAQWQAEARLEDDFALAINVSSRQLMQAGFVAALLQRLEEHGVPAWRIKGEGTESGLIQDIRDAQERLAALRASGVGVSIDDFGTGYSSLSYLKSLPVSELKIDRSFVKDIAHNEEDRKLVETIIVIAHLFGCSVVAEGIEHEAERQILRGFGCEHGQGYLFARPLPPAEFAGWLTAPPANQVRSPGSTES